VGRVRVGRRRIYVLAYADDVVLLAEEEEEIRGMMRGMEKYIAEKGLEVNVMKSKVIRFRRREGERKRWNGGGRGRNWRR